MASCDLSNILVSKKLFWPLTKRGLLSELVVASYIQSLCQYYQIQFHFFSSPLNIRYWRSLFPLLDISVCPFPSSYVSPVRGEASHINFPKFFGLSRFSISASVFQSAWSEAAENYFADKFDLYSVVRSNLTRILHGSACFGAESSGDRHLHLEAYDVVHLRLGDKVHSKFAEAPHLPLEAYVRACCENFSKSNQVYVVGDSPNANDKLAEMLKCSGFLAVSPLSPSCAHLSNGYDQTVFNKFTLAKKVQYSESFILDFAKIVFAKSVVCTFSSNVGRSAALLRGNNNITSIHGDFRIVQ